MCEKSAGSRLAPPARTENAECARTHNASSEGARTHIGVLGVDGHAYGLYPCSPCGHVFL